MSNCSLFDSVLWDHSNVSLLGFNFLAHPCINDDSVDKVLEAPATFFIETFRLTLAILFVIIVASLYNSIKVLGRIIFSVASCSIHWIIYFSLIFIKSVVFVILLPVIAWQISTPDLYETCNITHMANISNTTISNITITNTTGFVITTLLQICSIFVLFSSMEHEFKYRSVGQSSGDFAPVDFPLSRRCASLLKPKYFFTYPRLIYGFVVIIAILLLTVIEVSLGFNVNSSIAIWVWLFVSLLLRVGVSLFGLCLLFIRHETLRLTIPAKIYLVFGILLSLGDELPNSLLTIYAYNGYECDTFISYVSPYDIIQFMSALSMIAFFLFVRSQYLRIEQETKLSIVWDMQRLLQVNGRKDYRTL